MLTWFDVKQSIKIIREIMNTQSIEFQFLDLFNPLYLKGFSSSHELTCHYENMRYAGIFMFLFIAYECLHFLPDNHSFIWQLSYFLFFALPLASIVGFWLNYYGDKFITSFVPNKLAPEHISHVWKLRHEFILMHLEEISSFTTKEKEILNNYQAYSDDIINRIIYRNWHQTLRQIVDKRIKSF